MEKQHPVFDGVEIGIGTWSWGDRMVWGFGNGYNETDVREAFYETLKGGVTFFDTAEVYGQGRSESILGGLMNEVGGEYTVATKIMPFPWRLGNGSLYKALQNSMERLGVSRVALYQMHQPFSPVSPEKWMVQMAKAHEDGLIEAVGVSNYSLELTRASHEALKSMGLRLASNQVEYHLLDRHIERNGLLDYCAEEGIKIIAYSPIAMGILSGKYSGENPPGGIRGARYPKAYLDQIQTLLKTMSRIGNEHGGKSTAQVAINWTIQKGTLPIPGAKNATQAMQNIAASGWKLTSDEMELLDELSGDLQR